MILPDVPLLLSGACGGPFVIFLCTPMRNGLTLGSQDRMSGMGQLYKKVFRGGAASGWTGGGAPAVVACPQFLCLGPVWHMLHGQSRTLLGIPEDAGHRLLPAAMASLGAGLCETVLTYGSQSRNAQMAYNKSFVQFSSTVEGVRRPVPLNNPYQLWGAGAGAMALRNMGSIVAVRGLSPWLRERLPPGQLSDSSLRVACDVTCSVVAATVTAPLHQLFNFLATTAEASSMPAAERARLARSFLNRQYFVPLPSEVLLNPDFGAAAPQQYSWRISSVAARDFGMRTVYVTTVFTLFMSIERFLCSAMRS